MLYKGHISEFNYAPEILSDEQKKANGIKDGPGVFITGVATDGAAETAGIKKGDFVTKINDVDINSGPELQEQIAVTNQAIKLILPMLEMEKNILLHLH